MKQRSEAAMQRVWLYGWDAKRCVGWRQKTKREV